MEEKLKLEVGCIFYSYRLGYPNSKPLKDCKTLEDYLGIVFKEVEKVNTKTFRFKNDSELYKEVPNNLYLKTDKFEKCILNYLSKRLSDNRIEYRDNIRGAYLILTEKQRNYVNTSVKNIIRARSERVYARDIEYINSILSDNMEHGSFKETIEYI